MILLKLKIKHDSRRKYECELYFSSQIITFRAVFNVKFMLVGSSVQKSSVLVESGRPARPVPTAVAITLLAIIILPNPEPNQVRVKNGRTLPNRTEHSV